MTDGVLQKSLKVLLVDDDAYLVNMYAIKFKSPEFKFFTLPNADGDFVGTVATYAPDIILMDIDFSESVRNGAEAAEVLQVDERTKSIPIVFLTNGTNTEKVAIAKTVSVAGFLFKANLTPSEVVSKVQALYLELESKRGQGR